MSVTELICCLDCYPLCRYPCIHDAADCHDCPLKRGHFSADLHGVAVVIRGVKQIIHVVPTSNAIGH